MIPNELSHLPLAQGKGVSRGFAVGKPWVFRNNKHLIAEIGQGLEIESNRFKTAQSLVLKNIEILISKTRTEVGEHEAEIFEAHSMMIQDEELVNPILQIIKEENTSAEMAVENSFKTQIEIFKSSESEYMRERVLDLRDLKNQLIEALDPSEGNNLQNIPTPVILVAKDLTPSQTITMDRKNVLGMIIEKGGETSHTAIIARTMGIPAIVGVANATKVFLSPEEIGIDGETGSIYLIQDSKLKDYFENKSNLHLGEKKKTEAFRGKKTRTADDHSIQLFGNIGNSADAITATQDDVEGIGLFRTEFLFMERDQAPTLEEQKKIYQEVLTTLAPKEVIIRTIDIGGDKPIPYIQIAKEENPFLGVRAFRYCLKDLELFKTQIKAMLLANTLGNLSIMIPMISRASEAKQAAGIIQECHEELKLLKEYPAKPYKLGVMVEIPSLVFELNELKGIVSFVSVGTNDLMQYSMAVDRMNPELQYLYSPYNLGFIRMMNLLASEAKKAGLDTSICGELGGVEDFIPLWIAMGFKKLSMVSCEVMSRRSLISKFDFKLCQKLLTEVLSAKDETEVKSKLKTFLMGEK